MYNIPTVSNAFLKSVGATPRNRSRRRGGSKKLRLKLIEKDPYCYYCGILLTMDDSTLDHTIPKSKGGSNRYRVLACYKCNQKKGDKIIIPWNILREENIK